jgi:hypothetical protein
MCLICLLCLLCLLQVLSQVHPELNISRKAMDVMQSFMTDAFEQIADEAARLTRYSECGASAAWLCWLARCHVA